MTSGDQRLRVLVDPGVHSVVTKPFDMNAVEELVRNAHRGVRPH